ncbi:MAG: AIR synthase family protein [Desulfofundulus sp.]
MQPGKLAPELLNRIVFPYLGAKRQDVLVRPGIGQDCSVVDFGSELAVLSSDPITASGHHLGYLAVHVSANDIAATGAEPVGLLLTLLLPPGTSLDEIEAIMRDIHAAAGSLNMAVLGGHTEFTNAVCQPVAAVTALGRAPKGRYITAAGGRPGDTLLLTKTAGCEGTAILASDLTDKLEAALGADLVRRAQGFIGRISVVPEGRIAAAHGASAMHDVTEGGVLGAVAELATASGCGVELWADKVPLAPETAAICEVLGLNPLGLIGSGSLLIASAEPDSIMSALRAAGIPVTPIGRLLRVEEGLWLIARGERQPLIVPPRDELYRAILGG